MGQRVKLRLNQGKTDNVQIGRGVRQGCCMSPILFNLYEVKDALTEVGDFKMGEGLLMSDLKMIRLL